MNHLAHALLADSGSPEFALGSALGDFWHGHPGATWTPARQSGLRLHRVVDAFTDAHPEVVAARRCFAPPLRRYAGIMLDVWFDYLLVHAWPRFDTAESLAAFSQRWLELLDTHATELPESLQDFLAWMHTHALPAAYGDDATLDTVFHALARRLSRPSPLGAALPALQTHAPELQQHFDIFFPQLLEYVRAWRSTADASRSAR